jgi:hypothetical protein
MTKSIRDMQSAVNGLLQSLDSLKSQIEDRKRGPESEEEDLALEKDLKDVLEDRELSNGLVIPELEDRPSVGEARRGSREAIRSLRA